MRRTRPERGAFWADAPAQDEQQSLLCPHLTFHERPQKELASDRNERRGGLAASSEMPERNFGTRPRSASPGHVNHPQESPCSRRKGIIRWHDRGYASA